MRTPCMGRIRSATQRIGIRWVVVKDGPMNGDTMCLVHTGGGTVGRDHLGWDHLCFVHMYRGHLGCARMSVRLCIFVRMGHFLELDE